MRELPMPEFLSESGAPSSPYLLHTRENAEGRAFDLPEGETIIGSAKTCAIRLDSIQISERHCRIRRSGMRCVLEDLQSDTGTFVNGSFLTGIRQLNARDKIKIGPMHLEFRLSEPAKALGRQSSNSARPSGHLRMQGKEVEEVPLWDGMVIGRGAEADVELGDPAVAKRHMEFKAVNGGFEVVALPDSTGFFINGLASTGCSLAIGDRIQIASFHFRHEGRHLRRVPSSGGARIRTFNLTRKQDGRTVLDSVSVEIRPREFVGILSPNVEEKTALLDAMSGLQPTNGRVVLENTDLNQTAQKNPSFLGYLPSENIVHEELTVRQAIKYSARLRYPKSTPRSEIRKLVRHTMQRVGLEEQGDIQVKNLTKIRQKRVGLAVEMLSGPQVLFLDKPTLELDSATRYRLMELLRSLAYNGCTIVCATHPGEYLELMDRLIILDKGKVVFDGPPESAKAKFAISNYRDFFSRLNEGVSPESTPISRQSEEPDGPPVTITSTWLKGVDGFMVMLRRQWAVLRGDPTRCAMLCALPPLIGALISWATSDTSHGLLLAAVAAVWFGCANGSQAIVREIAIFKRERFAGLGLAQYLGSKYLTLCIITILQGLMLLVVVSGFGGDPFGGLSERIVAIAFGASAGVAMGLALSAVVRSTQQAVLFVPFVLIPMILLGGHLIPLQEMRPSAAFVAPASPAFATMRLMEISMERKNHNPTEVAGGTNFADSINLIPSAEIYYPWFRVWDALIVLVAWTIIGLGLAAQCLNLVVRKGGK